MPADLQKARELFLHAVGKLSPDRWEEYIVAACGGDNELEQQLRDLLRLHREAGSFLEHPAAAAEAARAFAHSSGEEAAAALLRERPGTVIGPYKLLQQVGEGGMGVVFMAEQTQPVQRKVALKVIKPGMDSRQIIARFEAERQALAMMDHVNIARVLEAGATESGRPYFVMELVHGVPITKYCDDNHLNPRERLELFVPVCQAIQHAHQKGIIHRDIKPSNVMITLYDGKPVPKVIDFGVAKATEQRMTERTLFTQYGTMVGTLEYMSPEQAEMSALGIDTRSDIYSMGVLLYELLTGSTPLSHHRVKEAAYAEILRMIKEEEPPKPSTRLSDSGEALASISAQRQTEPAKLTKLVRGELDWIVMKALEKDRCRRYETANGLAADLQRYLADEPVLACPPSSWYRFRKFARRNKAVLATTAALALGLLLAVAGLALSNLRISRALAAETQAKEEIKEANARERSNFYRYALGLARRDWLVSDIDQAKRNLQACPPELRDGDWRYLQRVCHAELSRFKHIKNTGSLQYSPDGKALADAGNGPFASLTLWDAHTGQEQFTSLQISSARSALAFTPDGKRLVWAGTNLPRIAALDPKTKNQPDSFTVSVWDVAQRKQVAGFKRESYTSGRVMLSPDASRVALVDLKRASICETGTGRELFSLAGPIVDVQVGPVFHPGGQILASYAGDRTIRFWDGASGKPLRSFSLAAKGLRMLAFSPDGRCLIGATYDDFRGPESLAVWDGQTGRDIATLRGHTGQVSKLAFSPDGRRLASAASDKVIITWDLDRGRELLSLRGHTGAILGLAFSPDGQRLASSSADGTLRIWDAGPWEDDAGPNDTDSKK